MCYNFAVNLRQTMVQTRSNNCGKLVDMVTAKSELVSRQIRGYNSDKMSEKGHSKLCKNPGDKCPVKLPCTEKKILLRL
jgi:hypothetical protein